ncbi:MAG: flagellar hook-basal body complex protein [Proteobacteria bacterium]|nr:flagellar hook-basal body complex protein [Pseudomonadota bacterium]MDA0928093.1 flagellar hook-basal body complex protein [Pseudomonadota bacterium]
MSFYTSLTGLNAATTQLSVTSNNIANAGTSGFKRSTADFGDIFATSPLQKSSSVVGAGVSLKEVRQEFSQGNIEFSANSLDLAITGDGFFALETPDGTKVFTRNGGFMLNEQNQMVNSAGQALMSLPVDSTNKADFSEPLTALSIPRNTVSEFQATSQVELGLNLPSDAQPITQAFNPNKPETYHKTTSLTVYGASGSSHLATIYYVKTATATADSPFNKWQTHVYIDEQAVEPALIQASDNGDEYFVNKYGEIKTRSELLELQRTSSESEKYLITTGTLYKKYSFDRLSTPVNSTPATIALPIPEESPYIDNLNLTNNQDGVDFARVTTTDADGNETTTGFTRADFSNMFQVSVDGSAFVDVGLEHLAGRNVQLSGAELAFELTNVLNTRFGDGRKFNLSEDAAKSLELTRILADGDPVSLQIDLGAVIETAEGVSLSESGDIEPEALAFALNDHLAKQADPKFDDLSVEYDEANRGFRFTQNDANNVTELYLSGGASLNPVFGVSASAAATDDAPAYYGKLLLPLDNDEDVVLLRNVLPNGAQYSTARDQRYGIEVTYSDGQFRIQSGTTGDESSLQLRLNTTEAEDGTVSLTAASALAASLFGIPEIGANVEPQTSQIDNLPTVRGQRSEPAVLQGNQMGVDPRKSFSVTAANQNLTVIVDGISAQISLTPGQYSIGTFTQHLQNQINLMADSLGRTVSGVKVDFDDTSEALVITGATASNESFIQVAGHSDWGLEDLDAVFGSTSNYIQLEQDTQGASSVYVIQDNDGNWNETTDKGDFDENNIPYWSPIFLDKGELTFDTSGSLVSPISGSRLESESITGTAISIDYANSTQFNSPFAVLSQTQNGAPEGDLVGVNIGDDGLVVASYSNGSQRSLGKIIVANFATPQGLRQIGDSSFYETSESGGADYGEPGSAGFGTLRAGARERSNVDLTAELVDLITAQRNFQANAKAIETTTSMTQTIINIRG